MKKLLLVVGLIFFLTPMFASADQVRLSCKCFKHEFIKGGSLLGGHELPKEFRQCPPIDEIWTIDYEKLTIQNKEWEEWTWEEGGVKLNITSNSQNQLESYRQQDKYDVYYMHGVMKVTIKDNDKEKILTFKYDSDPNKKKSASFKYSSSCKELQRIVTIDPFEAKQQLCEKLGFSIGSQENGNCVLKIFEIESNLKQKEKSAGGQLTEADKLIRQQRLNQSLMLMQQGLNLMSPPQPKLNCRNTITGWACY